MLLIATLSPTSTRLTNIGTSAFSMTIAATVADRLGAKLLLLFCIKLIWLVWCSKFAKLLFAAAFVLLHAIAFFQFLNNTATPHSVLMTSPK